MKPLPSTKYLRIRYPVPHRSMVYLAFLSPRLWQRRLGCFRRRVRALTARSEWGLKFPPIFLLVLRYTNSPMPWAESRVWDRSIYFVIRVPEIICLHPEARLHRRIFRSMAEIQN